MKLKGKERKGKEMKLTKGFGVILRDTNDPIYHEGIIDMADYVIKLMEDYSQVCVDVDYDYEQWLTMHMERAKALATKRQGDILSDMAELEACKRRAGQPAERSDDEQTEI